MVTSISASRKPFTSRKPFAHSKPSTCDVTSRQVRTERIDRLLLRRRLLLGQNRVNGPSSVSPTTTALTVKSRQVHVQLTSRHDLVYNLKSRPKISIFFFSSVFFIMADQQQLLLQLYQQLQADIQQRRTDNQQLRAEILSLRKEVQAFPPSSTRQTLPGPPKFDGKPYLLRTWLPAMRAKIRTEGMEDNMRSTMFWDRLEPGQQGKAWRVLSLW